MTDLVLEGFLSFKSKATTIAEHCFFQAQSTALLNRARREERDKAIHAAFALLEHRPRSSAVKYLAQQLRSYLAAGWRSDRNYQELSDKAKKLRRQLHQIAVLNDGKEIGEAQLRNIYDGHRG